MAIFGIDVSEWQKFTAKQYEDISKKIKWVILREGYGTSTLDKQVKNHIAGFKKNGVPVIGVYHFIYAINETEAKQNAENCIKNMKELGLPKTTRVWCDFEYDTVNAARKKGVTLGAKECQRFTEIFCETVSNAGYPCGVYTNGDYYVNYYQRTLLGKYPVWLADYTGGPDYTCIIQQFASAPLSGVGFSENLDLDYLFDEQEILRVTGAEDELTDGTGTHLTVDDIIENVLALAESEVGYLEKASNYNLDSKTANAGSGNYTKYGRDMHNVQPSNMDFPAPWCDAWCDWLMWKTFGTSLAKRVLCGDFDDYTVYSANHYKRAGRWSTVPERGYQVFFKNKSGICHTGIVYRVANGRVYTIEGNSGNAVQKRSYLFGDSTIAGYGMPRYELAVNETPVQPVQPTPPSTGGALSKEPKFVGKVNVSANSVLNVRTWAGTEYPNIKSWPVLKKDNLVDVCDTIKASDGSDWYYIRIDGRIFGFVCAKYIVKV